MYEYDPGLDELGDEIVCDCPCVPLISEKPLSVGTMRTVPASDMRKLFARGVQVAPPSDDDIERNEGAGVTSVVGVVVL
jgi:hypothetical protein